MYVHIERNTERENSSKYRRKRLCRNKIGHKRIITVIQIRVEHIWDLWSSTIPCGLVCVTRRYHSLENIDRNVFVAIWKNKKTDVMTTNLFKAFVVAVVVSNTYIEFIVYSLSLSLSLSLYTMCVCVSVRLGFKFEKLKNWEKRRIWCRVASYCMINCKK